MGVWLHASGTPCDLIMAILDNSDTIYPFFVTTCVMLYALSLLSSATLLLMCQFLVQCHELCILITSSGDYTVSMNLSICMITLLWYFI